MSFVATVLRVKVRVWCSAVLVEEEEDDKKQTAMDMVITRFLHTLYNIGINSAS